MVIHCNWPPPFASSLFNMHSHSCGDKLFRIQQCRSQFHSHHLDHLLHLQRHLDHHHHHHCNEQSHLSNHRKGERLTWRLERESQSYHATLKKHGKWLNVREIGKFKCSKMGPMKMWNCSKVILFWQNCQLSHWYCQPSTILCLRI